VVLRTPPREGKFISYWRLTTKEGIKFGHRLWCDVAVEQVKPIEEKAEEKMEVPQTPPQAVEKPKSDAASSTTESSQMIFPKLEKESPVASIHEEGKAEDHSAAAPAKEAEDFEQCDEDDEWAEDDSDEEGVNTDEEYDILDASDEEPLDEHQK
jgi:next-to-BRCA1 protein 1